MRVTWDGKEVEARPGQTVAGVLLANGVRTWRTTRREGRPRGPFCGIGVCFDCLVRVNGVPDVRACLRQVADGDDIRPQWGAELPSRARSGAMSSPGTRRGVEPPPEAQPGAEPPSRARPGTEPSS